MNIEAIQDLLYRIADDDLILGHRHSEWTGLGPILEEDIAFSSMAQDEIGHAQAWYVMLHEIFGEATPDSLGFGRPVEALRCCQFVEMPNQDYAFSLVRHALYDLAEMVRLEALCSSSFMPAAELAKKLSREEKYHHIHALTWVRQLGTASADANARMQAALDQAYPLAQGLFEPTQYEAALAADGVCPTEAELRSRWEVQVKALCTQAGLLLPNVETDAGYGGRQGKHTPHLASLLKEMTEVYVIDPTAVW